MANRLSSLFSNVVPLASGAVQSVTPAKLRSAFLLASTLCICFAAGPAAHAQSSVLDPSSNYRAIMGKNGQFYQDVSDGVVTNDVQGNTANGQADLVGDNANPLLFVGFNPGTTASNTDGTLFFRTRLNGADNGGNFSSVLYVALDSFSGTTAGAQDGKLDLFLQVNLSGSNSTLNFLNPDNTAANANTSPNTTAFTASTIPSVTLTQGTNYNFASTGTSLFGSSSATPDADYFLTFAVPFQTIISAYNAQNLTGLTDQKAISFLLMTATQANSINGDFGGDASGSSSTTPFSTFQPSAVTPTSLVVTPEPSSIGLVAMSGLGVAGAVIRRRRNA